MRKTTAAQIYRQTKSIEGWFCREAAMMFAWIDEIQKSQGIRGDIFEIGCHHGKSAILLSQMVRSEGEQFSVCDLFSEQQDNVSGSGQGDLDLFRRNLEAVGKDPVIYQCNSAALTVDQIGNNYRLFHIDGGHNGDEAYADLTLAAESLVAGGVILVDDPFRYDWPGVTEAIVKFLGEFPGFCAVMAGCNKLVLTHSKNSDMYLDQIDAVDSQEQFGFGYPWQIKQLPFCSSDLRIVHVPDYRKERSFANLARFVYYGVRSLRRKTSRNAGRLLVSGARAT